MKLPSKMSVCVWLISTNQCFRIEVNECFCYQKLCFSLLKQDTKKVQHLFHPVNIIWMSCQRCDEQSQFVIVSFLLVCIEFLMRWKSWKKFGYFIIKRCCSKLYKMIDRKCIKCILIDWPTFWRILAFIKRFMSNDIKSKVVGSLKSVLSGFMHDFFKTSNINWMRPIVACVWPRFWHTSIHSSANC